jgi:hypothetical protein
MPFKKSNKKYFLIKKTLHLTSQSADIQVLKKRNKNFISTILKRNAPSNFRKKSNH